MLHVIAAIETVEGRRDEFLAQFKKLVPVVCQEEGCIEYGPALDFDTGVSAQIPMRENVVTVVERWESLEALQAHLAAPHMREFREATRPMVVSITLQVMQPA